MADGGDTMGTPRSGRFRVGTCLLAASLAAFSAAPVPARAATRRLLVQKRYFRVISGGSVSVTFKKPNTAGNLIVALAAFAGEGP